MGTNRDKSELVGALVALRAVPWVIWVPIPKDLQARCRQAASVMHAGRFRQARGPEGWEADVAPSTAKGSADLFSVEGVGIQNLTVGLIYSCHCAKVRPLTI